MASRPLRPCLHPGCTALVRSGYCAQHQLGRVERRSAESRAWRRWYSLPIWTDELRPKRLLFEPWCRAIELSPHNCDVIIQRWEEMRPQGCAAGGRYERCQDRDSRLTPPKDETVDDPMTRMLRERAERRSRA
nr:hypothetical protein [uncultured Agathobaculum sp.]